MKLFLLALVLALGTSACSRNDAQTVAFPIGKAGATATANFDVRHAQTYAISLQYSYKEGDQADRAQIWELAGGSAQEGQSGWSEPGAPLRVQVRVVEKQDGSERLKVEQIVSKPRLSSWGSGSLWAELTAVSLDPGSYRVTVVSLDEAPSFIGARTGLYVGMAHHGK